MAEEIKVSAMTFLDTVPDNAKIYVVVPGDPVPYYTTKEALLAGIGSGSGTLQQVTENGNETNQPIVFKDINEFADWRLQIDVGEFWLYRNDGTDFQEKFRIETEGISFFDDEGNFKFWLKKPVAGTSNLIAPETSGNETIATQEYVNSQLFGKTEVKNANFTAVNGFRYVAVANLTVTDPTPAEGLLYEVLIANGASTIGGTAYNVVGTVVRRFYHSGAWITRTYVSDNVISSAVQTALDTKITQNDWVDHSSFSTINGFSTLSTVVIKYIPIGKSFMYYFFVSGVSNGPNFTFTIHTNHLGSTYFTGGGLNRNGGNLSNNAPRITVTSNSATISVLNTLAGSTWSTAGNKEASGWFIVESN